MGHSSKGSKKSDLTEAAEHACTLGRLGLLRGLRLSTERELRGSGRLRDLPKVTAITVEPRD